ncbi:hypothetical protein JW707_04290 [Candidatus Woesearchaeota archaeon]|nr:hypothetical protein [Candidatus Woesearchaeota archaeon]
MRDINRDCSTINELVMKYEQDAALVDNSGSAPENADSIRKIESKVKEYKRILDYWGGRCTEIEMGRKYAESLYCKLKNAAKLRNTKPPVLKTKIKKFANACTGLFLGGVLFAGCTYFYDSFSGHEKQNQPTPVESAISSYLEQIDRNPSDYRIHLELSQFYEKNGMTAEAEKEYCVALKIIKNNHP